MNSFGGLIICSVVARLTEHAVFKLIKIALSRGTRCSLRLTRTSGMWHSIDKAINDKNLVTSPDLQQKENLSGFERRSK